MSRPGVYGCVGGVGWGGGNGPKFWPIDKGLSRLGLVGVVPVPRTALYKLSKIYIWLILDTNGKSF